MKHEQLKEAAYKFKSDFTQVIVESKTSAIFAVGVGNLGVGILNQRSNDAYLVVFINGQSQTYTKGEAEECFRLHDYNDWSV